MKTKPFPIGKSMPLPERGAWPATVHVFDRRGANAIETALAAQRPLLVRGEPGVGKSQLARAAAEHLGRLFVAEVVHARSESQDLQWRFDAVGRLGEAQALGHLCGDQAEVRERLAPLNYLSPGPLWWVFDWDSALEQYGRCPHHYPQPEVPAGRNPADGCVLLIDEIDKADADLPNGLLETLGNGRFSVPYLDRPVGRKGRVPLVIITTNEERELPRAFVRRCLVLHLRLPSNEKRLLAFLVRRGRYHFGNHCPDSILKAAAKQVCLDRREAREQGFTPPGQAEYLDILRALSRLAPGDERGQRRRLATVSEYALNKYAGTDAG